VETRVPPEGSVFRGSIRGSLVPFEESRVLVESSSREECVHCGRSGPPLGSKARRHSRTGMKLSNKQDPGGPEISSSVVESSRVSGVESKE
jgi:hypothetical protein